jgi:hypothetical protein
VTRQRIPDDVLSAAHARSKARAAREWPEADRLRAEIEAAGWRIVDRGTDFALSPAAAADETDGGRVRYGSSRSVPSARRASTGSRRSSCSPPIGASTCSARSTPCNHVAGRRPS